MEEDILENSNTDTSQLKNAIEGELASYINPAPKTETKVVPPLPENVSEIFNTQDAINQAIGNPAPAPFKKPVIRTYKSDVEETVQAGHISSVNIAVAENKRMMRNVSFEAKEPEKRKFNVWVIIIVAVLIIGGILAVFIPFLLVQNQNTPQTNPVETVSSQSIIAVDSEEKINIKDINISRIAKTLSERVDQSAITIGTIKNIYLTNGEDKNESLITSQKFLSLINANIPGNIARTLKTEYMFGMHSYNGNQKFLILKVGEYDLAYSGMLSWENDLWQDFTDLFALQDGTVPASSTNQFTVTVKKFQDATFFNKDSRVVKNANGQIIFLYSIIDDNTIVITTSADTLKEILDRTNNKKNITQ